MYVVVLRFQVADFEQWLGIFQSRIALRREAGCLSSRAYEMVERPGTAVVILEWDDLEKYRAFAKTGFVQNARGNPMILDEPDIYVLEERASSEGG